MIPESKLCRYCGQPIIIAREKRCKGKCGKSLLIIHYSHSGNTLDHRRRKCRKCDNAYNRRRAAQRVIERLRLLLVLIGRGFWEKEELRKQAGLKPQQFDIYIKRLLAKGRIIEKDSQYRLR